MKKLIASIFAAAAVMPAFAAAEAAKQSSAVDLINKDSWMHKYMMSTPEEGVLRIRNMHCLYVKNPVKLEAAKKYTIRGKVRIAKDSPATRVVIGFTLLDKTGRTMPINNFMAIKNSYATLTEAVKVGDKSIKIKADDPKVWRPVPGWAVAFQAQKDLSDLPNSQTTASLAKVEKNADGTQTVTFKAPVKYDFPAGTQVRLCGGYSIYFNVHNMSKEIKNDWHEFSVSITGETLPAGVYTGKQFPHGVDSIRLFMMVNWLNKKALTEFKDLVFEVE